MLFLILGVLGCKPTSRVAVYDGFELFANDHRSFYRLTFTCNAKHSGKPLFVKIGSYPPINVSDLSEAVFTDVIKQDVFADWQRYELEPRYRGDASVRNVYASRAGNTSLLEFENGKLTMGSFSKLDEVFSFSRSPDGPFVELGLTRSELKKAFGRPKRWETRTRGGV